MLYLNSISYYVSRTAAAGLLGILAFILYTTISLFFKDIHPKNLKKIETPTIYKSKENQQNHLLSYPIFGKKSTQRSKTTREHPIDDINLKLVGVFYNEVASESYAWVYDKNEVRVIKIGKEISNNYWLKSVTKESVKIITGTGYRVLPLWEKHPTDTEQDSSLKSPRQVSTYEQRIQNEEHRYSYKFTSSGLEKVSQDSPMGYKVTDKESDFSKYGAKVGDKVISLNGYPLGEGSSDEMAIKSIADQRAISLVIERNGKEITLSRDLRLIRK